MSDPVIIVGHKNPDNDAISAAVGFAYFENELAKRSGEERTFKPCRLGPLPPETEWVMKENGIEVPELIESVDEGADVILVDHNELSQAVDGLAKANVIGVVDHHRIGDVTTASPIWFTGRPWGSTATIVTTFFRENDVELPKNIATQLYSAILTDTVILKSPTATNVDKAQVEYLQELTGLDPVEFGQQLFRCRGGEAEIDIERYVCADSKEFQVGSTTVLIGQHETVDLEAAMEREEEARAHMRKLAEENGYDFVLLMVTDIINEGSNFLVEGNHEVVDKVFDIDSAKAAWMPGVLSRKKQVAAPILASAE